jgi:hypothetical protein
VPEGKFTRVVGVVFEDENAKDEVKDDQAEKCGNCANCTVIRVGEKQFGFTCNNGEHFATCHSYELGTARFADGKPYGKYWV